MRGIFLVSCFLGGSALLAGCREENNSPRPATEDAARITSARQWGRKPIRAAKTGTGPRCRSCPSHSG